MNDAGMSVIDLRGRIAARRMSAEDAARAALARCAAANPRINALTEVFEHEAIEQSRAVDRRIAAGERVGPLAGVPVVVKDNICLAWGKTTCASKMLKEYRSPFTATAAQRLVDAGAVVIGKGNLDEFAMGSSGEHSCFGATRNPWDVSRVPGGSSSGSTAAVSAGMAPVALGSDTGGSIRMPAGLCNVVGFKPTYGRVSRYGLVAYASSLDQIGPLTTTVADAALVGGVISGRDARDSTCAAMDAPDWVSGLEEPVNRLVLGVPTYARSSANHPGVTAALESAIEVFRSLGATVIDVELPTAEHGIAAYYLVACAEASSNLARFDGVRYGYRATMRAGESLDDLYARSRGEGLGNEVQKRIMLGTYALSSGYYDAYYNTALKTRRLIKRDFDRVFAGESGAGPACHAVLMPSSPSPAFRLGEKTMDPLAMYLEDVYTVGVNLAGLPAITVPGGFAVAEGGKELPVGVQLVGAAFDEGTLLRIARMFERETNFGARRAPALDSRA